MRWNSKRTVAAVAGVAALAAGGGVGYAASQNDSDDRTARGAHLADVAERLGISEEELAAAFQAEALERLDAAVAAGRIDEERAAGIRERIEQGEPPLRPRHDGALHALRPGFIETAAEYLELEPRELLGELRDATLAEVAEEQGKTAEGLEEALVDEAREHIHELVTEGLPRLRDDSPSG